MHCQIFKPTTSATLIFRMKHYLLLLSTTLLCRLSTSPHMKHNNVEIHMDDLRIFDSLEKDIRKVEAAMELFTKQGKAKVAQEISEDEG